MKQKIKAGLLLLLAISLVFTTVACGRGGGSDENGGNEADVGGTLLEEGLVYVPEFIRADLQVNMWPNLLAISGDTLYFSYWGADGSGGGLGSIRTDGSGFRSVWQSDLQGDRTEGDVTIFTSENILMATARVGGGILAVRQSTESSMNEVTHDSTFSNEFFLMAIGPDGNMEREVPLSMVLDLGEFDWLNQVDQLSDGRVLISSAEALSILSPAFTFERQIPWEGQRVVVVGGDRVMAVQSGWDQEENSWETTLVDVDINSGRIQEEDAIALPAEFMSAIPGVEYDLYVLVGRSVYALDVETRVRTLLFNWMDMDIQNPTNFVVAETGDIFLFENQWGNPEAGISLVRLSKQAVSELPEQTVITFGALFVQHDIQQEIIEFNRRNPHYRIQIVEYWDMWGGEELSDAIQRFHADLLAGNVPDIMEFRPETPFDLYARRGFLADIGSLIDADPVLNRGDLVESVARLLETNGRLYTIAPQFSIQTLIGREDLVGPGIGWTMSEFLSVVEALPEGASAFDPWISRESFMWSLLGLNLGLFIDRETGITNFDSPLFMDYLAFARTLRTNEEIQDEFFPGDWGRPAPLFGGGVPISPPIGEIDPEEIENPYATGQVLLMEWTLWSFLDLVHMEERFAGPVAFKGYPSEELTGSAVNPTSILGISANTAHMDVAWNFVRSFLTEDYQRQNMSFGFSIDRNILREQMQAAMEEPEPIAIGEDEFFVMPTATQAQVDQILALIEAIDQFIMRDETVMAVIEEEIQPYFAGDRNLQETVRIIQSRVQMIISERR